MGTVTKSVESLQTESDVPAEEHTVSPFLQQMRSRPGTELGQALLVGKLLALTDAGATPLVALPEHQDSPALPARTTIDLLPSHIGRDVLLIFEHNNIARPIVIGLLRGQESRSLGELPGQVRVDADGQRLIIDAKNELVLRCGKATFILRSDGRIELRGESILTQAAETNRIRGGSVQLN